MVSFVESTVSLIIQFVVLALIISALSFKKRNRFREHGTIMISAVILHIISILVVMVPSFAAFISAPGGIGTADIFLWLTIIHVSAGIIAAALGIWLISSWRLQEDLKPCFDKKRVMDVTITLWVLAIALGIILYLRIIQTI